VAVYSTSDGMEKNRVDIEKSVAFGLKRFSTDHIVRDLQDYDDAKVVWKRSNFRTIISLTRFDGIRGEDSM